MSAVTWLDERSLADAYGVLLFDLDGVVYVGRRAVAGAVESLARARAQGLICTFVTNNASRPPTEVAAHLRELEIAAEDSDVVTSAQEGASVLAARLPSGSEVLAIGGPGVSVALAEVGLTPVTSHDSNVVGVLQGFGPEVGWRELSEASYAVTAGALWVATNPDLTVPTPRGRAPGNGQLAAVVQRTTGVDPVVTGKPGPGMFVAAVLRAGGGRALVVGDRLDTDIAGAVAAGLPSLLALTGVSGTIELLGARPGERPSYVAEDLGGLWTPQPAVVQHEDRWMCRQDEARLVDGELELSTVSPGASGAGDSDGLDRLRVAAAAVWTAADSGVEVDLDAAARAVGPLGR